MTQDIDSIIKDAYSILSQKHNDIVWGIGYTNYKICVTGYNKSKQINIQICRTKINFDLMDITNIAEKISKVI